MKENLLDESRYDAIVVGSGIAGLRAAVDLAEAGARVAVLTKDSPTDSNTGFAQGGIAVALSEEDRIEFHLQDTLRAGDGLCDEEAVRILVEEGPPRIQELIDWGTRFDREGTRLAFAQEGAHSRRRVLHAHGDSTGSEIVRALLARASAFRSLLFLTRSFSVDLVLEGGRCTGLLVLDEGPRALRVIGSGAVLLATGGAGRLYRETTNPPQATGDGVAMAYRAGATVADLEFVQFHPTCLYHPDAKNFLISEAVRGEGGILINAAGNRFMEAYSPLKELACRDVVARAIDAELKKRGDDSVFLDISHKSPDFVKSRFPNLYEKCLEFNIDMTKEPIPVVPAAHYMCGGVVTDIYGRTNIQRLFAIGETACTGLHGANRLASNSLLEVLVFGRRIAERALALEAARKSIVLLKNEAGLLPLEASKLRSLAVIGPNAAALRLGGYSGDPGCGVSVLDGIHQKVGQTIQVRYAEGCGLTQLKGTAGELWQTDEVVAADPAQDEVLIAQAVETANDADVTLLVLGDNEQTCREGWSTTHLGDRDSLDLPGRQEALLRAVAAIGKPLVLLLIQGRPASLNFAAEHVPAILEGWYLGQAAGTAVADVLFGDVNPGGKLPVTFPRSVGQIPAYYYHKPSARRGYLFTDQQPLFPFGHGLSYTTFVYSSLILSANTIQPDEAAVLSVDVTNTGQRAGDEVVQFYVHDLLSERVTRPVKLLKGFQRINLQPGETRRINFSVGREQLQFLNEAMCLVVEPGQFELLVGGSSQNLQKIILTVVV